MQIALSSDDIETIIAEAEAAARRLQRRLGVPAHALADLRQDLLLDLVGRLPAYDPARGSLRAFAGLVLRNQASRIAIRVMRERQAQGGRLLSLDAPTGGDKPQPFHESLSEEAGLSAWHEQPFDARAEVETSHAIAAAFGHLSEPDTGFCVALSCRPLRALAAEGFGSRSTLGRRLHELRHRLTAYGLGPCWDASRTA